jgi:hypothetical protein
MVYALSMFWEAYLLPEEPRMSVETPSETSSSN